MTANRDARRLQMAVRDAMDRINDEWFDVDRDRWPADTRALYEACAAWLDPRLPTAADVKGILG